MISKENIFQNSPFGYALHKIVVDDTGKPIDYEFIEVNKAFEKLTGLKQSNIVGKNVTEAIPGIEKGEFDWIGFYGKVALEETEDSFEQFSEPLGKHYSVQVYSPQKEYFVTIFTDISAQKNISEIAAKFNAFNLGELDLQYITDKIRELSGAKYAFLNIFDENGRDFTTMAFSGLSKHFEKAISLLGFDFRGKKWKYDPERQKKIEKKKVTVFQHLTDLTGKTVSKNTVNLLCKTFSIGQTAIVKAMRNDTMLGDFTLIFYKKDELQNQLTVETIADMTSQLIHRLNAESKLKEQKQRLSDIIYGTRAGTWEWNIQTGKTVFNERWAEIIGYSLEEISPTTMDTWGKFAHPDDLKKSGEFLHKNLTGELDYYEFESRMKHKNGDWIWVLDKGKVTAWSDDGKPLMMRGTHQDITEQKISEQKLIESEKFQKTLLENVSVGIMIIDPKTRIIEAVNKYAMDLIGLKNDEIIGQKCHPFVCLAHEECCPICDKGQIVDNSDKVLLRPDGKEIPILKTVKHIFIDGKEKLIESFVDISEKKASENLLKKSEDLLKNISQQIPGVIYQYQINPDGSGCFPFASEHIKDVYGVTPEEVREDATPVINNLHPEDKERVIQKILESKNTLEKWDDEYRVVLPDKGEKWVRGVAQPELLEDQSVLWHGYIYDITEIKKEQIEMKRLKEQFELAVAGTNDGIWDWDLKTDELYLSKRWKAILGYEDHELENHLATFMKLIYKDDVPEMNDYIQSYLQNKISHYSKEFRMVHKDGTVKWILAKGEALRDEKGIPYRMAGSHSDITQRKEMEAVLKENQIRLELAMKAGEHGFWDWNLIDNHTYFSPIYYTMLGYEDEELPMNLETFMKLIHPEDGQTIMPIIQKSIEDGKPYEEEFRLKCKDGSYKWILGKGKTYFDEETKKPNRAVGVHIDINDRKIVEEEIKESEAHLNALVSNTPAVIYSYTVDIDGRPDLTYVNNNVISVLGFKPEDFVGNMALWVSCVHPEDIPKLQEKLAGKEMLNEYRFKDKNGKYHWLHDQQKVYKRENGITEIIGAWWDVTERKEMEQQLKESQLSLKIATEGTETGVWDWDMVNDSVTYSIQWKKMLGYEDHEVENTFSGWKNLWHPDDAASIEKAVKDHLAGKTAKYEIIHRCRHKDGDWRWIITRGTILKDNNNKPYRWVGTNVDITKLKQIEDQLFKEKDQFKTTLLSVGDGIISTDAHGKVLVLNPIAEQLTGWTQEEAYNQPLEKVLNIIHEYTRETCINPAKKALELGITVEMENHTILIAKNGKEVPIEDGAAPIKDIDENVTGAVITFRDFSEKKEKQKEIEYLSFHDHLTGLYNRRYMEDSIKRLDTDRNIPFSIIAADINGLKLTNDTYGHEMGDKLLINTSEILKKSCRKEDIICRAGGDEFIILLPSTDEKNTKEIIERIKEESKNTILDSVIVSIALGYSIKHKEDEDIFKIHKEADNNMYKNKLKIGKIMRSKTIETLLVNINNKYDNEQIHTERVSQYCEGIAKAMNLNEKDVQDAKIAGVLHDIGKIVVSPEILNKEDKLTDEEWEEIKKHPTSSYQILKNVDEYAHLAEDVLCHHERLDGTGYPGGLKEDEIPLLSKIIAVADAYEAMTANRPYKETKTKKEAIEELKKHSGTQFDKKIVDVFINVVL
jgi:diguanylate cyclase